MVAALEAAVAQVAAASEVADKYALKGFAICQHALKGFAVCQHALKGFAICQHALKGQKLLAQGIALGYNGFYEYALKGQKLYKQLKLEIK